MVKFVISQALFQHFPKLKVGVVIIPEFNNSRIDSTVTERIRAVAENIKKELATAQLSSFEEIKVWRQAYSFFGAKPKKYKASVEALLQRIVDGEQLPTINRLVDIYNYLSIKYKLPFGADDLSKVTADIKLTFADGKETFQALNSKEIKNPQQGEVVYKMENQALCRRWNWREADATKITENTTKAILYCESLLADDTILKKALRELQQLTKGEVHILDAQHNAINLSSLKLLKDSFQEFYPQKASVEASPPPEDKRIIEEKSRITDAEKREDELYHWADVAAEKIIQEKGDKKKYTVAAGITPSGTVHIGNFREIITVDLVKRALEKRGKKVRFIYSWDDYDVFRKIPKNMPQQDLLEKYVRYPIVDTPDPFGCHESYARHHEAEIEQDVPLVEITPEFIYQAQQYRAGKYSRQIKEALENNEMIKACLDAYREEKVDENWLPISLFCEHCHRDTISDLKWLGGYSIYYKCNCGQEETFDFRKKGIVKLKWRVDWPMRWAYEQVDFEPGGKDHSTAGGSYDTGKKIVKAVWNCEAPTYVMYDFISVKGGTGKMSSSSGEVVTLRDLLEIYEPEIVRYLFAGTRPNREFAISFDADVIKIYEDFDRMERIYFGSEKENENRNEKETNKQKVAYELSFIGKIPKTIPYQPGFRHLTTLLQIHRGDIQKAVGYFKKELRNEHDRKRLHARTSCAQNWLQKYAPEEFKFTVQTTGSFSFSPVEKELLHTLAVKLREQEWTDLELHEEIYILCKNQNFPTPEFFKLAYRVLINKERGPRLASFILAVGKDKVAALFEKG